MFTDKIYYADQEIIEKINEQFLLVDDEGWYLLYQNKFDNTFWRLDKYDRLQVQFFVQLESKDNWTMFNDQELRIQLLLKTRGVSKNICSWQGCKKRALQNLAFCESHAYLEMGIRK